MHLACTHACIIIIIINLNSNTRSLKNEEEEDDQLNEIFCGFALMRGILNPGLVKKKSSN